MHIDREETDQRAKIGPGVYRRLHHGVVQMLALNSSVIAQNDVAMVQALTSVDGEAVAYRHTDGICDKNWHAASALRDQLAVRAD